MMMCAWGVTLAKKRTVLNKVQTNDKSGNCTLHFQKRTKQFKWVKKFKLKVIANSNQSLIAHITVHAGL